MSTFFLKDMEKSSNLWYNKLIVEMEVCMKVSIGCDHGGFLLKEHLKRYLLKTGREVIDQGCYEKSRVDYPDHAVKVAKDVKSGEAQYGILVCTTGIGMSITANKFKGIRAALVTNGEAAVLTREHNDSNIICLGEKFTSFDDGEKFVESFLSTSFTEGRHTERVRKIIEVEKNEK